MWPSIKTIVIAIMLIVSTIASPVVNDAQHEVTGTQNDVTVTEHYRINDIQHHRINGTHHHSLAANTQSCHATNHGAFNSYKVNVNVGKPFDQGKCDIGNDKLYSNGFEKWLGGYECKRGKNETLALSFRYLAMKSEHVNKALAKVFPAVNGFNCPDY